MIDALIIHWQPGSDGHRRYGAVSVLRREDEADFDSVAPYGYSKFSCRALVVDDRVYPMHETTPDAGYPVSSLWTLQGHESADEAEEAVLMALSPAQREVLKPGYMPVAERRAKRAAEDAAAEAKRAEETQRGKPQ